MDVHDLSDLLMWGLGLSAAGFIFVVGFLINVKMDLKDRVTKTWLEDHFERKMNETIDDLRKTIHEIRDALVGSVEKKGVITRLHSHDERIEKIEDKCVQLHGKP